MVAVLVDEVTGGAPAVQLTITGLGIGDSVVSVWRTADGVRSPVRGARRVTMVDADAVTDYDVPLGRPVTYEVEVISGPGGASRTSSEPIAVESDTAWIMDPLDPSTAVPIRRTLLPSGEPTFEVEAMSSFDYVSNMSLIQVMGTDRPMALIGPRSAAQSVNFSMIADAAEQNTRLRNMFRGGGQLLFRLPASWSDVVEGSFFAAVDTVSELPLSAPHGQPTTIWRLTADTVAAPVLKVLTATFTYGDVAILFSTYQQKQDALPSGATYLDDLKSPFG